MRYQWLLFAPFSVLMVVGCDSGRREAEAGIQNALSGSAHGQSLPAAGASLSIGTDSSGGGSSYAVQPDRSLFLDLHLHGAVLADEVPAKTPLVETKALQERRFDFLDLKQTEALGYALARLERREKKSPSIVALLKSALEKRSLFKYVFRPVRKTYNYFVPPDLDRPEVHEKIHTVVFFDSILGPCIHAPSFNQMGVRSQAAAFVHEALRYLQVTFGSGMTDRQIQELTAALILESDDPLTTLDSENALGRRLWGVLSNPQYGNAEKFSLAQRVEFTLTVRLLEETSRRMVEYFTDPPTPENESQAEALARVSRYRYHTYFSELLNLRDYTPELPSVVLSITPDLDGDGLTTSIFEDPAPHFYRLSWGIRAVRAELASDAIVRSELNPVANALNNIPSVSGGDTKPNWELDVHRVVFPFLGTGSIYAMADGDPRYSLGSVMESYFRLRMEDRPAEPLERKPVLECNLEGGEAEGLRLMVLPSLRFERPLQGWYSIQFSRSGAQPQPPARVTTREASGHVDSKAARLRFAARTISLEAAADGRLAGSLKSGKETFRLQCGAFTDTGVFENLPKPAASDLRAFSRGLEGCQAAAQVLRPKVTETVWSNGRTYESEAEGHLKKEKEGYAMFGQPVRRVIYDYAWVADAAARAEKLEIQADITLHAEQAIKAEDPTLALDAIFKWMEHPEMYNDASAALAELALPQSAEKLMEYIRVRDEKNLPVSADAIAALGQIRYGANSELQNRAESLLVRFYGQGRMGAAKGLFQLRTPAALQAMKDKLNLGIFGSARDLVVFDDPSVTGDVFRAALEANSDLDFAGYVRTLVHFSERLNKYRHREMFTQLVDTYFQDGHYQIGNGDPLVALAAFIPQECHW